MDNQQPQFITVQRQGFSQNAYRDGTVTRSDNKDPLYHCKHSPYLRLKSGEFVHRFIYESLVGEVPSGYQINRKDGNKHNNSVDNLELVTRSQNQTHKTRVLKKLGGTFQPRLSLEQTYEICNLLERTSLSATEISKMYLVSLTAIQYINEGKNQVINLSKLGYKQFPLREKRDIVYRSVGNLSLEKIKSICVLLIGTKKSLAKIAKDFNVSANTISEINLGKTYRQQLAKLGFRDYPLRSKT